MKILVKIGVLFLMLILLFAAFVLPKFVQRTEPPMPEEDLAAALAAVEIEETQEMPEAKLSETPESSPLREDDRLSVFYKALDDEDFVTSSDELVRLSSELDPDLVEQLTMEVEKAVASMGSEEADSIVRVELTPLEEESDPAEASEPVVSSDAPASSVDPASVVTFFSLVQSGEFASANAEIERLGSLADPATIASMKSALSSAEAKEEALAASRSELKQSQEEMARLQKESVSQIQASVKELAEVTKAAQKATEEANKLKTELASAETAVPKSGPAPAKPAPKPLSLPETKSVAFGFDSTFLNDASKKVLSSEVISKLEGEDRLQVQLRGHADTVGPSDYNGILARARCEMVKDFLLEQNIPSGRISIVSFGETQAAATGGTPEELRRVDIIFRAE